MKILIKLVLVTLLFATIAKCLNDPKLANNQKDTFPNTFEAPVDKKAVAKSVYTAPKMSLSLMETNPKSKIRRAEFLEIFKYSIYKLTRGEAEQIFQFADRSKDDTIDHREWSDFVALYVLPFESCDTNAKSEHLLDEKEFKACFNADPRTKDIQFRRRYEKKKNPTNFIISVLTTRATQNLNFSDYLFFRKALYGWTECHSTAKYLSKSSFRCALLSSIPQKYNLKIDFDKYYETGLKISSDRNLIELDFISYLRVALFTHYFVTFGQPLNTPFLERSQFIRAIQEDRLPTNFEEKEINLIYDLTYNSNAMDFPTFAFFFHLHRLFNKYSVEKPLNLNQKELLKLMTDADAPKEILLAIDNSFTNFSEPEYLEASLVLNKNRLSEKSFFSFKQDASVESAGTANKGSIDANSMEIKANEGNRKVFFSIMLGLNKKQWDKSNFYRAFTISNLFVNIRDAPISHNVGVLIENLPTLYDTVTPTFNAEQRKNYIFYKSLPKDVDLDLLCFLALENFTNKIDVHKFNAETEIEETLLKGILKDNGMEHMPDTVIDLAHKGLDSIRRREYVALDAVRYTMIVHSTALEIKRTKHHYKTLGLKPNKDNSRLFPDPTRRFLSSANI